MVKILTAILILAFHSFSLAEEPAISAQIIQAVKNQPIEVEIDIVHNKEQAVDLKSFRIDQTPIEVSLYAESVQKDGSLLSAYRFQLPAQPQGVDLLPAISADIGGKVYSSTALIYSVSPKAAQAAPAPKIQMNPTPAAPTAPTQAPEPSTSPILRLEATIKKPPAVYPGQKLHIIYKIYYHTNVDLTAEKLPLLSATGFLKLGTLQINNSIENDSNVQEISQEVKALDPGTYRFPPSLLEGLAYTVDSSGNKVYVSNVPYKTETPAITIVVAPFPTANRPASFNGTLGNYEWAVKLLTHPTLYVGDEIKLGIDITGSGELSTLILPDLHCQPGFSGFFYIKLPPTETPIQNGKHFEITLIPINNAAPEIPSIEFSYFDPNTAVYHLLQSPAIPIVIKEISPPTPPPQAQAKAATKENTQPDWNTLWTHPPHSEIKENIPLASSDLAPPLWESIQALWIIPLGLFILFALWFWRWFSALQQSRIPPSYALFNTALHDANIPLLEKALMLRLYEKGLIPVPAGSPDELPDSGFVGEVRHFLSHVQQLSYSGTGFTPGPILKQAKQLFRQISKRV